MYAFKLTGEEASSLTGTLTSVIGLFIIITAIFSGWIANWVGRRRLVLISGIVAALGNVLLLVTIWVPQLAIVYVAGTIIGIATGLFMTANWALGTDLVPPGEAGRYLGISEPWPGPGPGLSERVLAGWWRMPLTIIIWVWAISRFLPPMPCFFTLSSVALLLVKGTEK